MPSSKVVPTTSNLTSASPIGYRRERRRSTRITRMSRKFSDPQVACGYASVIALSLHLILGYAGSLLSNLIGTVYPSFKTVKAIESADKDDDTEWLMYWVVFAVFSVVEFFSDILLAWFPFYYFAKCLFLVWCMLPVSWNGSRYIYTKAVRPFVREHEENIDNVLERVRKDAVNAVIESGATEEIINRATQAAIHQVATESTEESATTSAETKKDA